MPQLLEHATALRNVLYLSTEHSFLLDQNLGNFASCERIEKMTEDCELARSWVSVREAKLRKAGCFKI